MTYHCSFCGKSQHDVAKLIAGPPLKGEPIFICDEDVELCQDILRREANVVGRLSKPRFRIRADGWVRPVARKRWLLAEVGIR